MIRNGENTVASIIYVKYNKLIGMYCKQGMVTVLLLIVKRVITVIHMFVDLIQLNPIISQSSSPIIEDVL